MSGRGRTPYDSRALRVAIAVITWSLLGVSHVLAAMPDSILIYEQRVKEYRKDGEAWLRLGQIYYEEDRLDEAQKAFHNAIRRSKSAESYFSLGKLYLRRCRVKHQSAYCIRVEPNLKKAIKADKSFAPAYLVLAEWFRDSGYEDRMIELLQGYVALRPDDADGRYGLALTYNELLNFDKVLEIAEEGIKDFPEDGRWLPLKAQANAARGEAGRALTTFSQYFELISEEERSYYENLSLIGYPGELDGFQDLAVEEQRAFIEAFWQRRDPTLTTAGRARQADHYRRIWHARTYFSEHMSPWDRRGDVYIRYGEPEYRSRSDRTNRMPSPIVQMIKERNRLDIYGQDFDSWIQESKKGFGASPEASPGLNEDEVESIQGITIPDAAGIEPSYPMGVAPAGNSKPWESWVYTQVGGGIEVVFTDEVGRGSFDYAPPPPVDPQSAVYQVIAQQALSYSPKDVIQRVSSSKPDHFTLPPGVVPIQFYYDVAVFRGSAAGLEEDVEVYFGIPPGQLVVDDARDRVVLTRTIVLATETGEIKRRIRDRLAFGGLQALAKQSGAFIPELAVTSVQPGDYRLAVELADEETGRWGIYLQDIVIPSYRDSLALSDIELAWTVSEDGPVDKFRKGQVRVIPMASRSYQANQSVYLYYEVYNLQKDEFGRTRYDIAYTIKQDVKRRSTLLGGGAKLFDKLFSNREPQLSVSYERSGDMVDEPIYIQLDTKKLKPGFNLVEVTVTDLVAEASVSQTALFRLDGNRGRVEKLRTAEEEWEGTTVPSGW